MSGIVLAAVDSRDASAQAIEVARLGWHLVVMRHRDKNPGSLIGREWQSKATVDANQILDWIRRHEHPNFGVLLGPKSNLIDLEHDTTEGRYILESSCKDVRTPTYRSSKSVHRLFKYDERFHNEKTYVCLAGTEWRFGHNTAQSVIPPSTHPDGTEYQWLPGLSPREVEPVQLSDELWELYLRLKSDRQAEREVLDYRAEASVSASNGKLNVETWLARHEIPILSKDKRNGISRWFIMCPKKSDHTNPSRITDCCITQEESGKLGGSCHHRSCGMTDWSALRDAIGQLSSDDYPPQYFISQVRSQHQYHHWLQDPKSRNENELATKFVDQSLGKIRHIPSWHSWLVWDGRRWEADSSSTRVISFARHFSRSLWEDYCSIDLDKSFAREELKAVQGFCRRANDAKCIQSYLNLARADKRISTSVGELNASRWKLNVANGTLDLQSGQLAPHSPDDLITQLASVEFHAEAQCPRWSNGLSLIFGGDQQLIRYVGQVLGYSISASSGEHILPIAWGNGFNGKSTITNVMLGLLGDYASSASDSLLIGTQNNHPTEKAFLYQKRFVPLSEPEQSSTLRESRVKELTGDATITARGMRQDFWTFQRTHTFWLSTNHLPQISGTDEGIWRRIKLIPFSVNLRDVTDPIPDLDRVLVSEEGSGILNWLIRGCLDYQQQKGFTEPDRVKAETSVYRNREDEIANFITECCEVESNCVVMSNSLYQAYKDWGGKKSQTVFGEAMLSRFSRDRPNSGKFRKKTVYNGIRLAI